MRLNLPILDQIINCRNILLSGMGGGYDVYCALPLYHELINQGFKVHLANFSFSLLEGLQDNINLHSSVVGIHADHKIPYSYFPEGYLSRWFRETQQQEMTIWTFPKTGVRPLIEAYRALIQHLDIDGIVLVDGGVDSLLHGDEPKTGTLLEDSISLSAVNELKEMSIRLLACIGLGSELDISYSHIFENIATLTKTNDYLGSCSLLKQMEAYQFYEEAVLYAHQQQEPSVINSSLLSAARGEYGDFHLTSKTRGSRQQISPLMPIYWFFNLPAVAEQNLLIPELRYSDTAAQATQYMILAQMDITKRSDSPAPLL